MNIAEWAAVIGVGLTTVGGIVAGVVHSNSTAFRFGQHSERLRQAEEAIKDLKANEKDSHKNETAVALLAQAMHTLQERFDKLDHDLRGWVMGKSKPPRASVGQD